MKGLLLTPLPWSSYYFFLETTKTEVTFTLLPEPEGRGLEVDEDSR